MNVWIYFIYWSDNYPTGPNDSRCKNRDQPHNLKPKLKAIIKHVPHKS